MFADDTIMWLAGEESSSMLSDFQSDILRMEDHLRMGKLKVNSDKTNYMILTRQEAPLDWSLKTEGVNIGRVSQMKYLGVIIDDKLTFKPNTEYVKKKVAKKSIFCRE